MYVTVLDVLEARMRDAGEKPQSTIRGDVFERYGLPILAGCERCGASLGCYNAYPSQTGNIRCVDCLGSWGFPTVENFEEFSELDRSEPVQGAIEVRTAGAL